MRAPRDPSVFELTADRYARVRPGYHDSLIEFVVRRAALRPDARLLELGCGPGLATSSFADRGYEIVAVDASERMLTNARRRLASNERVTFVHSLFQEWAPDPAAFDLVYAGMAWHWLPPAGRDAKVVRALRPGGAVAILVHWPLRPWDEGRDLYDAHWPGYEPPRRRTIDQRLDDARAELHSHGLLQVAGFHRRPWTAEYTADEYLDELQTYSDHARLADDVRKRLLDAVHERIEYLGGRVAREYESVALIARPCPGRN